MIHKSGPIFGDNNQGGQYKGRSMVTLVKNRVRENLTVPIFYIDYFYTISLNTVKKNLEMVTLKEVFKMACNTWSGFF
jgi:hypothetical protein